MTQYVLSIADAFTEHGGSIIICCLCLLVLTIVSYRYTITVKALLDRLVLALPLAGKILRLNYQSRFCYLLSLTTSSGLAMPKALQLIANNIRNHYYHKAVTLLIKQVNAGNSLHHAMLESKSFNAMVCEMVAIGEETGQLATMLQEITQFYQQQIDHLIDNLGNLLEPCMMVIIGLIIGGLVITMYLPVFNMGNIIS